MNQLRSILTGLSLFATTGAFAGTVVFHVGDPSRPPASVQSISSSYLFTDGPIITGGITTSQGARHSGGDVHIAVFGATYSHGYSRIGFGGGFGSGVSHGTGDVDGTPTFWFEFLPSYPGETPGTGYLATLQRRSLGIIDIGVTPNMGGADTVINAIESAPWAESTYSPPDSDGLGHFETGWEVKPLTDTLEFGFTWNSDLGKWIGKVETSATYFHAAYTSTLTVGLGGRVGVVDQLQRECKVIEVYNASTSSWTTFNTAW